MRATRGDYAPKRPASARNRKEPTAACRFWVICPRRGDQRDICPRCSDRVRSLGSSLVRSSAAVASASGRRIAPTTCRFCALAATDPDGGSQFLLRCSALVSSASFPPVVGARAPSSFGSGVTRYILMVWSYGTCIGRTRAVSFLFRKLTGAGSWRA